MEHLKRMLGAYNGHLKQIEQRLDVKIAQRGDSFYIDGGIDEVERAEILLQRLHEEAETSSQISADVIHLMIQGSQTDREFQEDFANRKSEELQQVLDRANKVIKQVAETDKYDVILQEAVYVHPKHDISEKVLKMLNASK